MYTNESQLNSIIMWQSNHTTALQDLTLCIQDIMSWNVSNMLRCTCNPKKTEIIHFSSCFSPDDSVPTIKVGDCSVTPCNRVKDLGDKLDCHLTFKTYINNICCSSHILFTTSEKLRTFYPDLLWNVLSSQCICFFNTWFLQQPSLRPSLLRVKEITMVFLVFDNSGCKFVTCRPSFTCISVKHYRAFF